MSSPSTLPDAGIDILPVLRNVFGFHAFRPNQEEIVRAILARRDAFVVMPTGGGKSLCYQLPAHVLPGVCMVVSPLISLMKDQVDAAVETGLRAAFINSSQTPVDRAKALAMLRAGELDLVYVSPERFATPSFLETLHASKLCFTAVDEAHCVSEWGHDFRPDYLNLSALVKEFPDVPVAAFTATATLKVQQDIIAKLGLRRPHMVRASFNRPNLYYQVVAKQEPSRQILEFVRARRGESGIIYRTTRKSVEETAEMLAQHGLRALPYHAGLEDTIRAANQEAFNRDEADVIVATIAFGMGIDKSNVRFVLHADLPKNIEGYYQETGRAGRDGEPAHCLLLFGRGDIPKIRHFIDECQDEAEKQRALRCLNDMVKYAGVHACRRKQLLGYFGEAYPPVKSVDPASHPHEQTPPVIDRTISAVPSTLHPPPSTASPLAPCCDVCAGDVESVDATRDAQIVLSAVARTGERFGINHIIDVVAGADTERIRQLGHNAIKTYGVGRDRDRKHWRFVVDNLLGQALLVQTEDQFPVLKLAPASRTVLFDGARVFVVRQKEMPRRKRSEAEAIVGDEDLFQALRALRKRLADEQHVPPYIVFSDRSLREMAAALPRTSDEMARISGVGDAKLARYGAIFTEAVRNFLATHPAQAKPPSTG